jgi:hypothetical protein
MPKLIGTAPNQVPTNGSLGNMAFQNKEGVITDLLSTTALTVTGTGAASFAGTIAASLGSAAAPSYTFTGDTNTGMFSPAADTIAFSEGGVEAMRITSTGSVGIGTTTAPLKLSLLSGVTTNNVSTPVVMLGSDRTDYYASVNSVRGSASTYIGMAFSTSNNAAPAEVMRIDPAGKVGIGTTAPNASALLDVTSTTSGFLPPRMTTTQRNAIATPADGLVVYNTTIGALEVRQAGQWVNPSTAGVVNTPVAMETDFINEYYTSRRSERTFDQLLDFTRTTSGTFVGSNGLIQTTPASVNLLTFTQQFDNAAWTKTAATVTANTTVAPDGTSTADKLVETTAASAHTCRNTATVTASTTYTLTVYAKAGERTWIAVDPVSPGVSNNITFFNLSNGTIGTSAAGNTAAITDAGNGWYRCTVTRTTAVGQITCFAQFAPASADNTVSYTGDGTSGLFIWGAQLEVGSTATTYTRNNGGRFPARFDYDPVTLAPKGILIEEQRTNLFTYSEQFDNAAWTKSNSTVTANAATSPDGTATADALIETTATGTHVTYQVFTFVAATAYTYSAYVKANGRTKFDFASLSGFSPGASFDLTAVTATPLGVTSAATITAVGNGWYRCTATRTSAGGSDQAQIRLVDAAGASTYTGDGTSGLFIYGAQLEAGAFATSYIPTVASQVTRSADVATMTGTNFSSWYNQSAGTFVFEGTVFGSTGFSWPLVASDNTAANRLSMYRSGAAVAGFISASGATQMEIAAISVVANVPFKIAVTAQANSGNFSFNGNIGSTDTSITMPTVNKLSLGSSASGAAEYLNGHIRSVRYFPVRLSNAQLQALTA